MCYGFLPDRTCSFRSCNCNGILTGGLSRIRPPLFVVGERYHLNRKLRVHCALSNRTWPHSTPMRSLTKTAVYGCFARYSGQFVGPAKGMTRYHGKLIVRDSCAFHHEHKLPPCASTTKWRVDPYVSKLAQVCRHGAVYERKRCSCSLQRLPNQTMINTRTPAPHNRAEL